MKAGWVDLKFIKNQPQLIYPKVGQPRMVSPARRLMSKIGYEKYRKNAPEPPSTDPDRQTQTAATRQLQDKLSYEKFRPESENDLNDSVSPTASKQRTPTPRRHYIDHGLGATRSEIIANCERYASHRFIGLSLLFSVEPDFLKLVEEAGQDKRLFAHTCAENFIHNLFEDRGWGTSVEFSYLDHDKPDHLERYRLHHHMTTAGSVLDPTTGERRAIPRIEKDDIQRSQVIADRTVEHQLDLQFGREWRLKFPEYAPTYALIAPDPPGEIIRKPLPSESEQQLSTPPDLFPLTPDATSHLSQNTDEMAPHLFGSLDTPAEFDSFGDSALLSRLVDDLFGEEMWQSPLASPARLKPESVPATAVTLPPTDEAAFNPDEGDAPGQVTRPESPFQPIRAGTPMEPDRTQDLENADDVATQILHSFGPPLDGIGDVDVAPREQVKLVEAADLGSEFAATFVEPMATLGDDDLDHWIDQMLGIAPVGNRSDAPSPTTQPRPYELESEVDVLATLAVNSSLTLTLERILTPDHTYGIIAGHATWIDPIDGPQERRNMPIYVTNFSEHLFFYPDRPDLEGAREDVESRLMDRYTALTTTLQTDFQAGLSQCFQAWQETLVRDPGAQQDGFLPGVPRELLGAMTTHAHLLPDLPWVPSANKNIEYCFSLNLLTDNAYGLVALRRFSDENGKQEIADFPTENTWDNAADSAQTLWDVMTQLRTDFEQDQHAAEQKWHPYFAEAEPAMPDQEQLEEPDDADLQIEEEFDENEGENDLVWDDEWDID